MILSRTSLALVSPERVELASRDLIPLDRIQFGVEGAHVLEKAAGDRWRQFKGARV